MTQPDIQQPKTVDELGAALTSKQRQFADTYLTNGLNASAAARAAKYRDPMREGWQLKNHPALAAYIQARLDEAGFTVAEIRQRLEYMVSGDMRDFLTVAPTERSYWMEAELHPAVQKYAKRQSISLEEVEDHQLAELFGPEGVAHTEDGKRLVLIKHVAAQVEVDWRAAQQAQALGRIKKLKVSEMGVVEFELHDPMKGLELLGKAQKMFTDKTEHSGSLDLGVKYIAGLSEDDL